jgi:cytoskeletal protein CcmA (bactofilin family)
VFKKVIGQDHNEAQRAAQALPETRHPEPVPVPVHPSYGSQQTAAAAARPSPAATRNVLSSDVEIKGTVKFTNDLVVDGKIEGEITSDGNLTIGENARIRAEVKTGTVIVYGKVHGNLTATERVELKASAEVVGDIRAKTLSIEAGAIFVGKSTVGTPAQAPATAQASPKSPAAPEPPKQGTLAGTVA